MSDEVSQEFVDKMSAEQMIQDNRKYFTCESDLINIIAEESSDALAVWVYQSSQAKTFRMIPAHIMKTLKLGRRRYATAIAVLKEIGVVRQKSIRKEDGTFGGKVTVISNYLPNRPEAAPSVTEHTADGSAVDGDTVDGDTVSGRDNNKVLSGTKDQYESKDERKPSKKELLALPDNFLREQIPEQAKTDYTELKAAYIHHGGAAGNVNRGQILYWRRVWLLERDQEFKTATQNMLNHRANQGTGVPSLPKWVESMDWEGNDDHVVPGKILLPGVPQAKTKPKPTTQQLCTTCNKPASSFVSDGRCMDCFSGLNQI